MQGWEFWGPGCADTPVSTAMSRECQHDDAQLPSCCLRVPAGLPSRTPGQGDTGLRPVTGQAPPAALWTGDTLVSSHPERHLSRELWGVMEAALPGLSPVLGKRPEGETGSPVVSLL